MAKDIAAFANALGGVILIGTSKDDQPLTYPGIPRELAERIWEGFADAHARHLSPKPPGIEHLIFPLPGSERVMLAVNVQPFADQIVGARVDQHVWVFPEHKIAAWRFPVRVGVDTSFLEPAMLPLYTTSVRRNLILLGNIDLQHDEISICFRTPTNNSSRDPLYWKAVLRNIIIEKNVVTVSLEEQLDIAHRIPIDDIDCIWDSGARGKPEWVVRVLGHFSGDQPARRTYHSNPSNAQFRS